MWDPSHFLGEQGSERDIYDGVWKVVPKYARPRVSNARDGAGPTKAPLAVVRGSSGGRGNSRGVALERRCGSGGEAGLRLGQWTCVWAV